MELLTPIIKRALETALAGEMEKAKKRLCRIYK